MSDTPGVSHVQGISTEQQFHSIYGRDLPLIEEEKSSEDSSSNEGTTYFPSVSGKMQVTV